MDLALHVLNDRWSEIEPHTNIPKCKFLEATEFISTSNVFSFNKVFYKQIFGTVMGSPISLVIANIVMEKLEQVSINKLPFSLPFYNVMLMISSRPLILST